MILISAVCRLDLFTPEGRAEWGNRPILCVSGGRDRRISAEYISSRVDKLRELGFQVTDHFYPEEDHFLLFSQRRGLAGRITAWMDASREGERPLRR
jgi:hypothetical protein